MLDISSVNQTVTVYFQNSKEPILGFLGTPHFWWTYDISKLLLRTPPLESRKVEMFETTLLGKEEIATLIEMGVWEVILPIRCRGSKIVLMVCCADLGLASHNMSQWTSSFFVAVYGQQKTGPPKVENLRKDLHFL